MTEENKVKLMQAYRAAVAAGQDEIADLLENVILGEMEQIVTLSHLTPKTSPLDNMPLTITCSGERAIWCYSRAEDAR